MRFPRFSIPTYFLLFALPLSFFISSFGLAFLGRAIIESERQSIVERDTIYARTVAEAVSHHVLDNSRFVETLAREAEARPFTPEDLQPLVQRFVLSNKMFHNMYIANVDGVVIADYFPAGVTPEERRSALGRDYSDRQYYKDLMARRTTVISDAVIGRVSGQTVVGIVTPIFGPDRSLVGFAEGALDLSPVLDIANADSGEEVAVTYVIDATGQVIAHSNRERVLELKKVDSLPPARQALSGQRGWIDSYIDVDGVSRSAAYTGVEDLNWGVWVAHDSQQLGALSGALLRRLIYSEIAILAAATLLLMCLSKIFLSPLKHISRSMSQISKGNFAQHVQIRNRFYPKEFDDVIGHFNEMVASLREGVRRRDELLMVKSRFLSVVTHYFRTPLTIMRWATESWPMHLSDFKKKRREEVLQVVEGVKRLNLGFQNLFTAIEIDDQHTRLDLRRTHLKPLVQRIVNEMGSLATFHGVELRARLLDVGVVPCDSDKISKVVEIIVANGIFYNHRGGRVEVEMKAQGGDVVLVVSDNGIGMAEEEMKHLFEPFSRTASAKKKFTDGSGLGLYIARAFVELHGGAIDIQSHLHEGTVVRITLPMAVRFKE